jgi:hypothetical protein
VAAKRQLIEPEHREISLARQCELLGLARSSWYYQPAGEDPYNLHRHETNGSAVYRNAILRDSPHDSVAEIAGRTGEPQACGKTDAKNG